MDVFITPCIKGSRYEHFLSFFFLDFFQSAALAASEVAINSRSSTLEQVRPMLLATKVSVCSSYKW